MHMKLEKLAATSRHIFATNAPHSFASLSDRRYFGDEDAFYLRHRSRYRAQASASITRRKMKCAPAAKVMITRHHDFYFCRISFGQAEDSDTAFTPDIHESPRRRSALGPRFRLLPRDIDFGLVALYAFHVQLRSRTHDMILHDYYLG